MLKLHKRGATAIEYWEAWCDGGEIIIHVGIVGQEGNTFRKRIAGKATKRTERAAIEKASAEPLANGFSEIPEEQQFELVVQVKLGTWGTPEDLKLRHAMENRLDQQLGWTGNGHVDGGDIGSGTLNIYAFVIDPLVASRTVMSWFEGVPIEATAAITIAWRPMDSEQYNVTFPSDYEGEFSPVLPQN
jgi:hypothetical protein